MERQIISERLFIKNKLNIALYIDFKSNIIYNVKSGKMIRVFSTGITDKNNCFFLVNRRIYGREQEEETGWAEAGFPGQ